jgi:HSP20 family protein
MNVTSFEPWSLFDLLHRDLNRIAGRRFAPAGTADDAGALVDWRPAVDILEQKDRFVLRADLPGVSPDAIDISMDKGVLTLSGERQAEPAEASEGPKRLERVGGKFRRSFTLPESVDTGNITAVSNHGILEVTIPKQPETRPRRITVQAA